MLLQEKAFLVLHRPAVRLELDIDFLAGFSFELCVFRDQGGYSLLSGHIFGYVAKTSLFAGAS